MTDHLDSKNLVPFRARRNGYSLPRLEKEEADRKIEEVDPDLQPEEQRFVCHYLAYADTLLQSSQDDPTASNQEDGDDGDGPDDVAA